MSYLIFKNNNGIEYVPLEGYSVFRIGRTSINEMVILEDKSVSREHCLIFKNENGNYVLRDLGSSNGTFLNGRKISSADADLSSGDRIMVGSAELVFSTTDPQYEQTDTSYLPPIHTSHETNVSSKQNLIRTTSIESFPQIENEKKPSSECNDLNFDSIPPGTNVKGYEVARILGTGQYSTVYLAFQKSVNRTVAFKVFNKNYRNPQSVESFLKQIQIMGRLQHQNILPCFDGGNINDLCYIAMLYVSEGSLSNKIRNSAPLEEKYVLSLIKKCADALAYALDEHGIIHLDIRPQNILFTDSSEPVLSDMGLSSWFTWAYQMNRKNYLGNPSYTSAEQALDQSIDWKADQYSLGIVAFECFTGKVPFQADNAFNLINKHKTEQIVFPAQIQISEKTKSIITKMTSKNPSDRFSSWRELISAIDDALNSSDKNRTTSTASSAKPSAGAPQQKTMAAAPGKSPTPVKKPLAFKSPSASPQHPKVLSIPALKKKPPVQK